MATPKTKKQFILKLSIVLFILLFVYTATSKLIAFEHFREQLGQMPLISSYQNSMTWSIPLMEYLIAILFVYPKYWLTAFYASLGIITAFTCYIIWVLNTSMDIPCSCGGVISKLTWEEHVIFNLLFILLAIINILNLHKQNALQDGLYELSKTNSLK